MEPSPDHTLLGYSVDNTGYETYEIRFKVIVNGNREGEVGPRRRYTITWSSLPVIPVCDMQDLSRGGSLLGDVIKETADFCWGRDNSVVSLFDEGGDGVDFLKEPGNDFAAPLFCSGLLHNHGSRASALQAVASCDGNAHK